AGGSGCIGSAPVRLRLRSKATTKTTPSCWWITFFSSRQRNSGGSRRRWDGRVRRHSHKLSRSEPPTLRLPNQRQRAVVRGKIFSLKESAVLIVAYPERPWAATGLARS